MTEKICQTLSLIAVGCNVGKRVVLIFLPNSKKRHQFSESFMLYSLLTGKTFVGYAKTDRFIVTHTAMTVRFDHKQWYRAREIFAKCILSGHSNAVIARLRQLNNFAGEKLRLQLHFTNLT